MAKTKTLTETVALTLSRASRPLTLSEIYKRVQKKTGATKDSIRRRVTENVGRKKTNFKRVAQGVYTTR